MLLASTHSSPLRVQLLVLLCLGLSLSSCGLSEASRSCNLRSSNLRAKPWTGAELADKTVSLIFLGGPSSNTAEIGSLLEQKEILGSFFVRGSAVAEHRSALEGLREQGHLIGNGGYTFTALTHSQAPVLEVRKTDALITPVVTGNMFLLHAPDDEFSEELASLLNRNGLGKYFGPIIADTVASNSFMDDASCWDNNVTSQACAQQYFTEIVRIKKGIIAFHDEDFRSLALLDSLLPDLKSIGFKFVRLDQIPDLRSALAEQGSAVDVLAGKASCDDYK